MNYSPKASRFCRICGVASDWKYNSTSASLPPCIYGKLGW